MALTNKLKAIADAIRGKTGKTDEMTLDQMVTEIEGIQAGGGDDLAKSIVARTITEIKDNTFETVGSYAFYLCSSLEAVDMPSVTTVGQKGFYCCDHLSDVNLPNVSIIKQGAFEGCSALVSIALPKATIVEDNAFGTCKNLRIIDFSALMDVNSKGSMLIGVSKPIAIIFRNETMATLKSTYGFNCAGYIYVPAALKAQYEQATNWSNYQFRALEDYTVDGTITGALDESKI